jgi:hypothetical protein
MKAPANLAIAVAVAGGLFTALTLAEANVAGLDLGMTRVVLPMVLGSGLFAGLNALAGNRRVTVATGARRAELLAFPPSPGTGWVVVMRRGRKTVGAVGFDVSVDDRVIAQLTPKRFTAVELPAGAHRIVADMPGTPGAASVVPLDVMIRPGAVQIFAIRSSMGLVRATLRLDPIVDTPAARTALARMTLVEAEQQGA